MLSVHEALIEDKNTLAFATEYVPNTLSTMLDKNLLTVLELKIMFIEMIETLIFLHEDAKVIHSYINPDCVFVDEKGKIKLSSFCFAVSDPDKETVKPNFDLNSSESPNLNYLAPEAVLDKSLCYKSDVFSFGVLLAYLVKKIKGKSISLSNSNFDTYKKNLGNFSNYEDRFLNIIARDLDSNQEKLVRKMLEFNYDKRISAKQIKQEAFFNDQVISALKFIESIETNDSNKNSLFFNQFNSILGKFEDKIIKKRILPKFLSILKLEAFLNNALPCIFTISEKIGSAVNFEQDIWPSIRLLFKLKQMTAGSLLFLVNKTEYISKNISKTEFSNHMLNLICKALDSNLPKLQKAVFEMLPTITKNIESHEFKNHIYQRMITILINTQHHEIRLIILNSMKTNYKLLDQTTINESFLSTLEKLRKLNNKTDICLKLVEIYQEISKSVSIEVRFFV